MSLGSDLLASVLTAAHLTIAFIASMACMVIYLVLAYWLGSPYELFIGPLLLNFPPSPPERPDALKIRRSSRVIGAVLAVFLYLVGLVVEGARSPTPDPWGWAGLQPVYVRGAVVGLTMSALLSGATALLARVWVFIKGDGGVQPAGSSLKTS